jgi:hypothetical protein
MVLKIQRRRSQPEKFRYWLCFEKKTGFVLKPDYHHIRILILM